MCYNLQSMSGEVDYQRALDYLYSFVDFSMTRSFRWSADKFDLKRMDDLMAALKEESVRVKKRDDSNLLRGMKGVTVQGMELVDELTALLKNLRK